MNDLSVIGLDVAVAVAGLALLLLDLWTPAAQKRNLGYVAAGTVAVILLASFAVLLTEPRTAFGGTYVLDEFALYFKRFFLLAAVFVLIMSVEFADRFETGVTEYYALILFALTGMMLAASANDFSLLFVSLELITVTFYILTSFQRRRRQSLEAGIKYLIMGALSSAFLVYGIALVFGSTGTMSISGLGEAGRVVAHTRVLQLGLLLVLVGLGFKIAMVPFQIWAPDVYQGSPTPTTAFLAVGSKAAGIALLMRLIHSATPSIAGPWTKMLVILSGLTILYGNLCAIPQRSLKRLLGYSSIANAGYLLMGVAAMSLDGSAAILYYLAGYLFALMAAFSVICIVLRNLETDDIAGLAGLHKRSPLLAGTLALSMVSLAGVPPLAGFFGKFLLLRSVVERASQVPGFTCLLVVAIIGVVISLYYYFGVIRAIYWSDDAPDLSPVPLSRPIQWALYACVVGMLWLGIAPNSFVNLAQDAIQGMK